MRRARQGSARDGRAVSTKAAVRPRLGLRAFFRRRDQREARAVGRRFCVDGRAVEILRDLLLDEQNSAVIHFYNLIRILLRAAVHAEAVFLFDQPERFCQKSGHVQGSIV